MQTKLFNSYFSDFLEMLKSKIIIRDQVASNEYSDHGGTWYMVHGTWYIGTFVFFENDENVPPWGR